MDKYSIKEAVTTDHQRPFTANIDRDNAGLGIASLNRQKKVRYHMKIGTKKSPPKKINLTAMANFKASHGSGIQAKTMMLVVATSSNATSELLVLM